jgi:hypothetical protein
MRNWKRIISAEIRLDDNAGIYNWQAASVTMYLPGWDAPVMDCSAYDTLSVFGTVEKNRKLRVRILQKGLESWLSYCHVITGNGIKDYEYWILLKRVSPLDFKRIYREGTEEMQRNAERKEAFQVFFRKLHNIKLYL